MKNKKRITREVNDQLNGDLDFFVKDVAISAYKESKEATVDNVNELNIEQMIDHECAAKSSELEEIVKNKENLMLKYFMSLRNGNTQEVENIKALIKSVSEETYQEFLKDVDEKIIAILKTLDMEKLIAEQEELDNKFAKDTSETPVAEERREEAVITPIAPIQEPTGILEVTKDSTGSKESVGSFHPDNTNYYGNMMNACGIDQGNVTPSTIIEGAKEWTPATSVQPFTPAPLIIPTDEELAAQGGAKIYDPNNPNQESMVTGWNNQPTNQANLLQPNQPTQPMTMLQEMQRDGIVVPNKKETSAGDIDLTYKYNAAGEVTAIGDYVFNYNELTAIKLGISTPHAILAMVKDKERRDRELAERE